MSIRCPDCNEEIDYVYGFIQELNRYMVIPDTDEKTLVWTDKQPVDNYGALIIAVECPECRWTLFVSSKIEKVEEYIKNSFGFQNE